MAFIYLILMTQRCMDSPSYLLVRLSLSLHEQSSTHISLLVWIALLALGDTTKSSVHLYVDVLTYINI